MQSRISLFNSGIFNNTLKRFWPMWFAYAFVLFVILPLSILSNGQANYELVTETVIRRAWNYGTVISFIMAAATAMCVFGYLYSPRLASLIASSPVRREAAFISSFAAGFCAMLGVNILIFIFTLIAEAKIGLIVMDALWSWFAIMVMLNIAFYGFAVFCAMLTGNIIVLPLVYAVLEVTVVSVEALVKSLLRIFIFGMTGSSTRLKFLSPPVYLLTEYPLIDYYDSYRGAENVVTTAGMTSSSWLALGTYCACGIIFAVIAFLLYRKRKMETASDVVAIRVLKPIFKYCLAFGCALVLSILLYITLFTGSYSPNGLIFILLFALIGGFIGYFAADMLIKKTFRVFSGNWNGFVIFSLILIVLIMCCRFDLFGYVRHIPDLSTVENVSITVRGDNVVLSQQDNIRLAEELQQSIIDNRSRYADIETEDISVYMTYNLKSGATIERMYTILSGEDIASDPESDVSKLQSLINVQEAINSRKISSVPITKNNITYACISYFDASSKSYLSYDLSSEQAADLFENCISPDIADGKLGRIWLNPDDEYYNNVYDLNISIDLYLGSGLHQYEPEKYDYFSTTLTADASRTLKWILDNTDITPVLNRDLEKSYASNSELEPAVETVYAQ